MIKEKSFNKYNDTIAAIASPPGVGALGIVRLSGNRSIGIVNELFPSKDLFKQSTQTLHVGAIKNREEVVDEVVVSIYLSPRSHTGEDIVEISCHGSPYILQQVLALCLSKGARVADPGEFTFRAFMNGKMNLSQSEAVVDLIHAESKATHDLALQQMKGKYTSGLNKLRKELVHLSSLLELELDFSEEDIEFADRKDIVFLTTQLQSHIIQLMDSFKYGNVLKNGVPVAIVGKPNAGKSSWINALINEELAIVSKIPGTTRDKIESTININGIIFRLIDTAGLRDTDDVIEQKGVAITHSTIKKAKIVLLISDVAHSENNIPSEINTIKEISPEASILVIANKVDLIKEPVAKLKNKNPDITNIHFYSVFSIKDVLEAKEKLFQFFEQEFKPTQADIIITNLRHLQLLKESDKEIQEVLDGINQNLTADLLAVHLRNALYHIGAITGEIDIDKDVLGNIFSRFCIGK